MTDLFSPENRGMVRRGDHSISVRAARAVKRETLKSRVIRYALDAGPGGFTDADLRAFAPGAPESSLRKRRTELTQKNWILAAGFTRPNEHGQGETVWLHRRFVINPPELCEAPKEARRPSKARDEERAAVCAYLKKWGYSLCIEAIERGDHLK